MFLLHLYHLSNKIFFSKYFTEIPKNLERVNLFLYFYLNKSIRSWDIDLVSDATFNIHR